MAKNHSLPFPLSAS
jgi:hypothetical protein